MTKNILTSAVVALIIAVGTWCVLPAKMPVIGASFGSTNNAIDGSQANLPNPSNYDYLVSRLALGLGTQLSVSATGAGNINLGGQRVALSLASTTVCAIQNPFNGTSTIQNFYLTVTTATSSATTFAIGTSSTQFGTTSNMTTQSLAGGAQGIITWDPGIDNSLIGPGAWITAGNGTGGVFYPYAAGGICGATFETAN